LKKVDFPQFGFPTIPIIIIFFELKLLNKFYSIKSQIRNVFYY
jgi:hypothetical protein